MRYIKIMVCICFLMSPSAFAATRYVDQDAPTCSEFHNGVESQPYCSIAAAFRDLKTGDTVRIRASRQPYRTSVSSAHPGPITIEADAQHNPVLTTGTSTTMIRLIDASQWTIRNLTFDGQGQEVQYAIFVDARSRNVRHLTIRHNRFINLGGFAGKLKKPAAVRLTNSNWKKTKPTQHNYYVADSTIADNVFDNCAHGGILLTHTQNVTVANNQMLNFRCGRYNDGRLGVQAVKVSMSSLDTVIRGNRIGNFQPSQACRLKPGKHRKTGKTSQSKYVGIYCDVGPERGTVTDNVVFNIDAGRARPGPSRHGSSNGIFIESRCADWKIHNNLIYNIGTYGFRNGSKSTGNANRTEFMHNTVYGIASHAISIRRGENLKIKYNILANYGGVAIDFVNYTNCRRAGRQCKITPETKAFHQTSHEINNNIFWQGTQPGAIATWFTRKNKLGLSSWQATSGGYDQESIYANPEFVDAQNAQFELRTNSVANSTAARSTVFGYRKPTTN